MKQYDAVVIGAGISGITAALILAKAGKKTVLIERDREIAPLIRPFRRKGIFCNPGLHITGWAAPEGPLSAYLRYLGVYEEAKLVQKKTEFTMKFILNGKEFAIPQGFKKVGSFFKTSFPGNPAAVDKYMDAVININLKVLGLFIIPPYVNFENNLV